MKYLLTDLAAFLFISLFVTVSFAQDKDSIQGDFEALQDIYEVTKGDNWTNNAGWTTMSPETMGDAYGVEVWESGEHQGRVKVLHLFDNNLINVQYINGKPDLNSRGRYQLIDGRQLKESLGNLKQMEYIDIRMNTISGDIPNSFWFLSNLKTAALGFCNQIRFNATDNDIRDLRWPYSSKFPYLEERLQSNQGAQFTGGIPSTVSNMVSLENLYLERNYFDQQQIPPELLQLPNIRNVAIGKNGWTGSLPNVNLGPNLRYLEISGGSFDRNTSRVNDGGTQYTLSGSLPPLWGKSQSLEFLVLQLNEFSGPIPDEWKGLSNLFVLNLPYNEGINGSFPNFINKDNMPRLNTLIINRMGLTGAIDNDYNAKGMAVLEIGFNGGIGGELPESFKYITHPNYPSTLKIWSMQYQNLEGPFMNDLSGLYQIRHVWAEGNNFIGSLPIDYPKNNSFYQLHLFSNNFTGAIPATMGNMKSVHTIGLANNLLDSYEAGAISPVIFGKDGDYESGMWNLRRYEVDQNGLSQLDLDQIILDLWVNIQSREETEFENWTMDATLNLSSQTTGAVPSYSSDVNAAIKGLSAAGWDVIYDGWENDDRTVSLPDTPVLLSPSDQSTDLPLTPSFEWEDTGAALYKLEILESSSNEQILIIEQEQTEYTVETELEENTGYTWRVRTIDDGLQSGWSASRTFTTLTTNVDTEDPNTDTGSRIFPDSPLLLGPVNNELNSSVTTELRWSAVAGADYYTLHMSRNSPSGMVIDVTVEDTVYAHPEHLGDNSVHNWRVRAVKDGEPGEWSEIFEFQTKDTGQPQMADLVSPDHFTQNVSVSPRFEWGQVDSDLFEIRIINKVTSETVLTDELSGYQYTPDELLVGETAYIWQVKNIKNGVEGAWSPRWEFATGEYDYVTSSPLLLSPDNGGECESLTPTFEWESVEADMYVISVSLEKPSKAKVLSEANQENTIIFEELAETYYTTEKSLEPETTYYWRVKAIKNGEESAWSETWEFVTPDEETASDDPEEISQQIVLKQNYPNPFNPATQIEFSVTALQEVSLKVYDLAGRQVADLVSGMMPAGRHEVTFQGDRLASGIYIYRLITDTQSYTKKMTLLK